MGVLMLEKMFLPVIDNMLAEYGLTRQQVAQLAANGELIMKDIAKRIVTFDEKLGALDTRLEGLEKAVGALLDFAVNAQQLANAERAELEAQAIPPLDVSEVENAVKSLDNGEPKLLMNGAHHDLVQSGNS